MYCEKLYPLLMKFVFNNTFDESTITLSSYSDEANCKKTLKYSQCIEFNFKIRCQETWGQIFGKLQRLNGQCLSGPKNIMNKRFHNNSNSIEINNLKTKFLNFVFIFICLFNNLF